MTVKKAPIKKPEAPAAKPKPAPKAASPEKPVAKPQARSTASGASSVKDYAKARKGPQMKTFENNCGEFNGTPAPHVLIPGEGFNVVRCQDRNVGVVFEPNSLQGTGFLAFMGSGLFCGEHETRSSAIHAVQVGFFG